MARKNRETDVDLEIIEADPVDDVEAPDAKSAPTDRETAGPYDESDANPVRP